MSCSAAEFSGRDMAANKAKGGGEERTQNKAEDNKGGQQGIEYLAQGTRAVQIIILF